MYSVTQEFTPVPSSERKDDILWYVHTMGSDTAGKPTPAKLAIWMTLGRAMVSEKTKL